MIPVPVGTVPTLPVPVHGRYGSGAPGAAGSHVAAIRAAAQNRLRRGVFGAADAAKAELDRLGGEIARSTRSILLTAPVKSQERSAEKVAGDYGGDWLDLKDAARITLIAPDEAALGAVIRSIRQRFSVQQGSSLIKDSYVYAPHVECGYSGYNGVVRFGMPPPVAGAATAPFHPILMDEEKQAAVIASLSRQATPAFVGRYGEIQANTVAMMYGKMSKDTFIEKVGAAEYFLCRAKFGVEGGAAHTLYEISRGSESMPDERRAAEELCRRYHRRLRGEDPRPQDPALNYEVLLFCKGVEAPRHELKLRWRSGAAHPDARQAAARLFMRHYSRRYGRPTALDFAFNRELQAASAQV